MTNLENKPGTPAEYRRAMAERTFLYRAPVSGIFFRLRKLSMQSFLSAEFFPAKYLRQITADVDSEKPNEEVGIKHADKIIAAQRKVIIWGAVEPKIIDGPGTDDALSFDELDSKDIDKLFSMILEESITLTDEAGIEVDLSGFPGKSGSGDSGGSMRPVESSTELLPDTSPGASRPGHGDARPAQEAGTGTPGEGEGGAKQHKTLKNQW